MKKVSKWYCVITLLATVLLGSFKGMLYISEHGYMLLKHELVFDIGLYDSYKYDTCYEAVVNGEHIYLICYEERDKGADLPVGAFQFSATTENYGVVEFALWKEQGEVMHTIIDPAYEMSYEFQIEEVNELLDTISDFFESYWKDGLTLVSYGFINEGRLSWMFVTLLCIVLLQLLTGYIISRGNEQEKKKFLFWGICMMLQLSVALLNLMNYVTIM